MASKKRSRPTNGGPDEWLSRAEAAAFLGLSRETLRLVVIAGDLPVYRPTPYIAWFKRADLEDYIRRHQTKR